MKTIFLDLETTGLNPEKNGIVQLSFIIDIDGKEVDRRNFFIRPFWNDEINPEALSIHGITNEQVQRFPHSEFIHKQIITVFDLYIDKYDKKDKFILIGFRTVFDFSFLIKFFEKCKDSYLGSYIDFKSTLDVAEISKFHFHLSNIRLENYKLETVAKYFDIDIKAHDAMSDIEATRKIYRILYINSCR